MSVMPGGLDLFVIVILRVSLKRSVQDFQVCMIPEDGAVLWNEGEASLMLRPVREA